MNTLAQRPGAEAALVDGSAEQVDEAIAAEAFPAWSLLSWEERAAFVARYCG